MGSKHMRRLSQSEKRALAAGRTYEQLGIDPTMIYTPKKGRKGKKARKGKKRRGDDEAEGGEAEGQGEAGAFLDILAHAKTAEAEARRQGARDRCGSRYAKFLGVDEDRFHGYDSYDKVKREASSVAGEMIAESIQENDVNAGFPDWYWKARVEWVAEADQATLEEIIAGSLPFERGRDVNEDFFTLKDAVQLERLANLKAKMAASWPGVDLLESRTKAEVFSLLEGHVRSLLIKMGVKPRTLVKLPYQELRCLVLEEQLKLMGVPAKKLLNEDGVGMSYEKLCRVREHQRNKRWARDRKRPRKSVGSN